MLQTASIFNFITWRMLLMLINFTLDCK